jgi:hypothetical protein
MTFDIQRHVLRRAQRHVWPLAAIAAASALWLLAVPAAAQQQQPRALPTFAVDPSWPKVPDIY